MIISSDTRIETFRKAIGKSRLTISPTENRITMKIREKAGAEEEGLTKTFFLRIV